MFLFIQVVFTESHLLHAFNCRRDVYIQFRKENLEPSEDVI